MASRLLRASYRMVKLMTEIELNEKITNLLSENPTQQKQSRRPYARENRVKKDDRLLRIIQRYYIPHAGYVDCGFDSTIPSCSSPGTVRSSRWVAERTLCWVVPTVWTSIIG